jgi:8-oxo-dGTP pyrophosphatase MutT (NUDIX family)
MYKVFIENVPIYFTEKNEKEKSAINISADQLIHIDDILPLIRSKEHDQNIFIVCNSVQDEVDRLFRDFEKIEAAGGIVQRKKRLLFIKRNGFWDIPKGKLETGEDIEQCAIREIEEECGISGPEIIGDLGVTYHTYLYHGIPTIKKTYWFFLRYKGPKNLTPQTEEGIEKCKWIKKKELKKVRENTFASINEVVDTYLAVQKK